MKYEEFKKKVRKVLTKKGRTWTEIKTRAGLKQKVPNNLWVKWLEDEGVIVKEKVEGKTIWRKP